MHHFRVFIAPTNEWLGDAGLLHRHDYGETVFIELSPTFNSPLVRDFFQITQLELLISAAEDGLVDGSQGFMRLAKSSGSMEIRFHTDADHEIVVSVGASEFGDLVKTLRSDFDDAPR